MLLRTKDVLAQVISQSCESVAVAHVFAKSLTFLASLILVDSSVAEHGHRAQFIFVLRFHLLS